MGNFDPTTYAPVDDRIADFYGDWPQGSIRTFVAASDEKSIMFEARCYRTLEEARDGIYTSGFAHEVQGSGPINRVNHVENAETSAVGRALANLGYSGKINGQRAARPSREEMEQASARREADELHAQMLAFIREVGARCEDDVEFKVSDKVRPLKEYVRENWAALKESTQRTRTVVEAIEQSTGEQFRPNP